MTDPTTTLTDPFVMRMLDEYGTSSPEYAASVYEAMLDGEYERRARLDERIDILGEHLEREKREIAIARTARRRLAAWSEHEAEVDNTALAELASDEPPRDTAADEPPRVIDDNGDWIVS